MLVAATTAAIAARVLYVVLPPLPPVLAAAIVLVPYAAGYFTFTHLLGVEAAGVARLLRFVRR